MDEHFPSSSGRVWLVGAGPGDPDLLTVKAARLIAAATALVHDGLVDPRVIALAGAATIRISVAKRRDRHLMRQEEINALLVRLARRGLDVVRLKGGDPFLFGRGGEELEALRAAGIGVEAVPGVSAAFGCAAEVGLPLTHRALASSVSLVAGTCQGLREQDWKGLAGPGRTLVIYMGVTTAAMIADKLMADGVSPDMPVAILERGTLPGARAVRTLLAGLGAVMAQTGIRSPAVLVVGRVAALAEAEDVLSGMAGEAMAMAMDRQWQ